MENLNIYLNTLKKAGIKISAKENIKKNSYVIKNSINLLNLNDEDIQFLLKIKTIISENSSINDVLKYNILLNSLSKYCDEIYSQKIKEIVSQGAFGLELHPLIKKINKYIEKKSFLLLTYNSPISKTNYFEVFPIKLKIENSKLYFICYDNNLQETRYLRMERILNIKEIRKENLNPTSEDYAICRFYNTNISKIAENFNHKIIDKNQNMILTKIYFDNQFEFFQKVLSYGINCQITEPFYIKSEFSKIIEGIMKKYAPKI